MRTCLLGLLIVAAAGVQPTAAQTTVPPPAASQSSGTQATTVDLGPLTNLRFSGLVHIWYLARDGGLSDSFRVKRTRFYLSGDLPLGAKFFLMIDPARALAVNDKFAAVDGTKFLTGAAVDQASRVLQDAYVTLRLAQHLNLQVGQFKLPLNVEGSAPIQDLPLVERSLMTTDRGRGGMFGDLRDVGVMARGTFGGRLDYSIGVFDGLGTNQNDLDGDDRKAVAGRFGYQTPVAGLRVGGFMAADRDASIAQDRTRMGLDVQYARARLLLRAELVGGRDGDERRRGHYGMAAYKVSPKIELALRLDAWDPDTRSEASGSNASERDYNVGFNYFLSGRNVRWQAEYERKTFPHGAEPARHVFLANFQVAW